MEERHLRRANRVPQSSRFARRRCGKRGAAWRDLGNIEIVAEFLCAYYMRNWRPPCSGLARVPKMERSSRYHGSVAKLRSIARPAPDWRGIQILDNHSAHISRETKIPTLQKRWPRCCASMRHPRHKHPPSSWPWFFDQVMASCCVLKVAAAKASRQPAMPKAFA
jgi:hypothetical protein